MNCQDLPKNECQLFDRYIAYSLLRILDSKQNKSPLIALEISIQHMSKGLNESLNVIVKQNKLV